MAISTLTVGTTNTVLFTSSGDDAVTFMSLCNYSPGTVTVSVHLVPSGGTAGNDNLFIKDIEIVSGDTYVLYEGGEKIMLGDGDYIVAVADAVTSVTAMVSTIDV